MKEVLELLTDLRAKGISIFPDDKGENLKVKGKVGLLDQATRERLILNKDGILALLKRGAGDGSVVPKAATDTSYPLSSTQARFWILSQTPEGSAAYHLYTAVVLKKAPDRWRLEQCIRTLIERHEILRTVFRQTPDGHVRQYVLNAVEVPLVLYTDDAGVETFMRTEFDLSAGPLLRTGLFGQQDGGMLFLLVLHHIAGDGWSMDIILRELTMLYSAAGDRSLLPELGIQYRDYAVWQQGWRNIPGMAAERRYWLAQLKDLAPAVSLPADGSRQAIRSYRGGRISISFPTTIKDSLATVCRGQSASLLMGLLTGVFTWVYRYTGQTDLVIGTAVAGRDQEGLDGQVGPYVNMLALRGKLIDRPGFEALLSTVKRVVLEAYDNQHFPFEQLVEELGIVTARNRTPLFDIVVVFREGGSVYKRLSTHQTELEPVGTSAMPYTASKFDLTFYFTTDDDRLEMELEYDTVLFEEKTVRQFGKHYLALLSAALHDVSLPVQRLRYLDEHDRRQLLEDFQGPIMPFPGETGIVRLFESQVMRDPGKNAIVGEKGSISYLELNAHANRLASYLKATYEPRPGSVIGVCLPRTEWLWISILAVLKTGAAFMPIDIGYPAERIDYMIGDSGSVCVIDIGFLQRFKDHASDYSGVNLGIAGSCGDMAYLIYTSGSTGKPKGVMVGGRSLVNLCYWHIRAFEVTSADRAALYAGPGFDAVVWEFFPYLLAGSTLYIVPDAMRLSMNDLAAFFESRTISIGFLPTQVAEQFGQMQNTSLRCLLTGGDKLSRYETNNYRLINNYGPTENTVVTTSGEVRGTVNNIPIGTPIANTSVYILDGEQQLCPIGVTGEIYIGGVNLAIGYHNMPEEDAARFVHLSVAGGDLVYRSGDLGRWLKDGKIEFFGRADDQVKLRGYRIEPGEVEAALRSFAGIDNAIVLASTNPEGATELVAYVCRKVALDWGQVRVHLASILPVWMLPGRFIQMDSFPLTANGKLDKRMLPDPWAAGAVADVAFVAPATPSEKRLAAIWSRMLGVERVGRNDDFFLLGGHSLKIGKLAVEIFKEWGLNLPVKELLVRPELSEQARLVDNAVPGVTTTISRHADRLDYPLSSIQQRLWMLSRTPEGNLAYSIPAAYRFAGAFDPELLQKAVNDLADWYEILRTTFFVGENGELRQRIAKPGDRTIPVTVTDLYQFGKDADTWIREVLQKPFDLEAGPLLRLNIGYIGMDDWRIVVNMHHIISDGWTVEILFREMVRLYREYRDGRRPEDALLPIQYRDFVLWQHEQLQDGKWQEHREYWLEHLHGYQSAPMLPADRSRTNLPGYDGGAVDLVVNLDLEKSTVDKTKFAGTTPFMFALAALSALLYRYSGEGDRVIGTPVAGRTLFELQDQLGCFINTLALRVRLDRLTTFGELLMQCRDCTLRALEHQEYPFDQVLDAINWPIETGRNPLFDVQLIYKEEEMVERFADLPIQPTNPETGTSQFDLSFILRKKADEFGLTIQYRRELYDRTTIVRMSEHFGRLLAFLLDRPDSIVSEADYLTEGEKEQLLYGFNHTAMPFPADITLSGLFYRRSGQTPNAVGLVFKGETYSFRELRSRSNRFARFLLRYYDIRPNEPIAVCLEKSDRMIISLLGILAAGGAYLPLDPTHPEERRKYIIADSGCKACVDEIIWQRFVAEYDTHDDSDLDPASRSSDLAYVIYTSGSTGVPKGCMLEHRGVVNRIAWMYDRYGFDLDDVILQKTNYTFDVSVWELFLPMCWGGRMVLCEEQDVASPDRILSLIASQGVTCLHFVPGMLAAFIAALPDGASCMAILHSLRRVITSGEALPLATVKEWYHRVSVPIHNLYGPTEASIDVTAYTARTTDTRIPIGQPIWNTRIYILGGSNELMPLGVAGEICLAGVGLARGYLRQPELTAERFIDHPLIANERIYRTGDLGRWLPDGNIEYLGRIDQQVKIRGHRVELGEVENSLLSHPDIAEAAVVTRKEQNGENEMLACLVFHRPVALQELRFFLGRALPAYMLPARFYQLSALPLSGSGKVDRKGLPGASAILLSSDTAYSPPRDAIEVLMVGLWKQVLGKDMVGIYDHFLESGGHSLQAMRLANRMRQVFEVSVELDELFTIATLEEQAAMIRRRQRLEQEVISPVAEADTYEVSDQQRRLWLICQDTDANVAYNMMEACLLEGALDQAALEKALVALIRKHELLRSAYPEITPGRPAQKILSPEKTDDALACFDLRKCRDPDAMLKDLLHTDGLRPFRLDTDRLFRAGLYRLGEDRWALHFVMHHIIGDGWSVKILLQEMLRLYEGCVHGEEQSTANSNLQYKDYAAWQNRRVIGEKFAGTRAYWLQKLSSWPALCTIPADHPRTHRKTFCGGALLFVVPEEDLSPLKSLGRRLGLTYYMQLLAVTKVVLFKYTGQEDIITGVPVSGRDHLSLEDQIGFYVNTLALRDTVAGDGSFVDLLENVKGTVIEAFRHGELPFGQIVELLGVKIESRYNPLFEVMVVLQDGDFKGLPSTVAEGKIKLTPLPATAATSRFDLNFNMVEIAGGLSVRLEFNSSLYDEASIQLLRDRWLHLLRILPLSPDMPLRDLSIDVANKGATEETTWDLFT